MSRRTWLFIVLAAAMVMAACAPAATPPPAEVAEEAPELEAASGEAAKWVTYLEGAKPGGTFVMAYDNDPTNLLPVYCCGGMQKYINQFHFGGLIKLVPDGKTWIPDVAESFEVSEDGKEYTFYLRTDVMTHDGQQITADDVAFSLEAFATPLTGSGGGIANTGSILGYEAFKEGEADHLEGVQKIDDFTVKITLTEAVPGWLLAFSQWFIVMPRGVLGELPYEEWQDSKYNTELPPPGIGPFQLTEYQNGVRVVFERNDNFYRGKPLLDEILIDIIKNRDSINLALERGSVQWFDWVARPTLLDMQEDPNLTCEPDTFRTVLLGSNNGISLNQDQEYLQDIRVRQAVAFAINPEEVAAAQDGGAISNEHMMPWNWEWSHSPKVKWSDRYTYDPEKARALLEEVGWDFDRELVILAIADLNAYQLLLVQQLEQVGFKIKTSQSDTPTYLSLFYAETPNHNWDIELMGIYGPDPAAALGRMDCDHPFTLTRWCDPAWDEWKKTAPFDKDEQAAFYQQADEYIFDNLVYVLVPVEAKVPTYGFACYASKVHMVTNQTGINWPETWWIEEE